MMLGFYEVQTEGSEPLTTQDAKDFLRVDSSTDDTIISVMITAARLSAERITNRSLIQRTWKASFPGSENGQNEIKKCPVTTVSAIEEYNEETETWDSVTDTRVMLSNTYPKVFYSDDILPPTSYPYGVRITFSGGYSSTTIPKALLQAIKMHVAYLYENRGDVEAVSGVKIPAAVEMIYRQYRIISTYA